MKLNKIPINQGGFSKKKNIGLNFPKEMKANVIWKDEDEHPDVYCGICSVKITEDMLLEDGTSCTFIIVLIREINGELKRIRLVLPICKECYLSHYNRMGSIIDYYKDDFMVESL